VRRAAPWLVLAAGLALVAGGIVVFWQAGLADLRTTVYSGSYAPLTPDVGYRSELSLSFDGAVLWTRGHVIGAGLVLAGVLPLVGLAGWAIGRRAGRRAAC
jgi:hypothetical protein